MALGVLTKPDRIPQGDEGGWLSFIKNEREPLEHNWYCVKQPSSADLLRKISWNEARQREDDFFATAQPWCSLDAMYHRYLRTHNLVGRLSLVLSELISKRHVSFISMSSHSRPEVFADLDCNWIPDFHRYKKSF